MATRASMIYGLTKQHQKLRKEFRDFVKKEISPYAAEFDKREYLPKKIIKLLGDRGYLGIAIPAECGGMGVDAISMGLLFEEIGKACTSVRGLLTVHSMVSIALLKYGNEEQKKEWLPKMATGKIIGAFGLTEPNAGSDAQGLETEGCKSKEGYVIQGLKKWITMGQIADVFLIFAKINNKPTAFLVDRKLPGLQIRPVKGMIGARASMLGEIILNQCVVAEERIIGQIGTGLTHVAATSLDLGRYSIAWGSIGAIEECFTCSVNYAKKRKQFGHMIGSNQLIQKMLAEMLVEMNASKQLCFEAAFFRNAGEPESVFKTCIAKYYASKALVKIAADAMQIHGAKGCSSEYPIERYYRDSKINEIIEGTSQIQELLIASYAILQE